MKCCQLIINDEEWDGKIVFTNSKRQSDYEEKIVLNLRFPGTVLLSYVAVSPSHAHFFIIGIELNEATLLAIYAQLGIRLRLQATDKKTATPTFTMTLVTSSKVQACVKILRCFFRRTSHLVHNNLFYRGVLERRNLKKWRWPEGVGQSRPPFQGFGHWVMRAIWPRNLPC